ncbi:MAG: hypothetical protein HKN04_06620 [Rhodothermaceae bacterium]|nr:hypothetical protein [Rhodothermaceae bacterium]
MATLPLAVRRSRLLLLLVLLPLQAGAQNLPLTALPFLEIPSSPMTSAIGGAGVALTEADAYGFLSNPAHLGLQARNTRAASALYPGGSTDWLQVGDLTLGSSALNVGFEAKVLGTPLTVGVGLAQTALRFGERAAINAQGESIGAYEPVDRFRALALGAATTGPVRLGLGATARHVVSTDRAVVEADGISTSNIWGITFDLGLLADADVTALLGHPTLGVLRPALSISAGYAQANIGGMVGYSGAPSQPLPRTARLGWSQTLGFDLPTAIGPFRLVEETSSVQAEHSLVRRTETGYGYRPVLGDMNVFQHALLGRGNEVVTGRRGFRLELGETVAFSRGSFDGWGFEEVQTRGFELHLAGPLKAAALMTGSDRLAAVATRFDVRYTRSVYFAGELNESTFHGLSLTVTR